MSEPLHVPHDLTPVLHDLRRLQRWKDHYRAAGLNEPQLSEAARHSFISETNRETST